MWQNDGEPDFSLQYNLTNLYLSTANCLHTSSCRFLEGIGPTTANPSPCPFPSANRSHHDLFTPGQAPGAQGAATGSLGQIKKNATGRPTGATVRCPSGPAADPVPTSLSIPKGQAAAANPGSNSVHREQERKGHTLSRERVGPLSAGSTEKLPGKALFQPAGCFFERGFSIVFFPLLGNGHFGGSGCLVWDRFAPIMPV